MLVKRIFQAMVGILLSGGLAGGSLAQDYEALFKKCFAGGMPDEVVASCSVVIARQAVDREHLATALKNRANAFDDKGEYARALEDYDRAVAINPQDADAFNSRGTTHTALGNNERAIQDFDEAIRLNRASPMAFSNRCFARAVVGQLEQALADCNEALRIKPADPAAFASRAFAYFKLRRYDAAIADYSARLRVRSNDPYALFGRGVARYLKGDIRGGDADLVAAQSLKPDIAEHMGKLGVQVRQVDSGR